MSSKESINKETLEHLAELGRIELNKESEGKLLEDLQKILGHFDELKEIDTDNVESMAGGTFEKNVLREDYDGEKQEVKSEKLIEQFPEKENGFLKVPAVFE